MPARQEHPCLFGHPDWSDQQINRSLEERRVIALNPMPQEQKDPTCHEKTSAPDPFCEEQENDPGEDHGDTDTVKEFVPTRGVFVVVLRHVVRQVQSAPPYPGTIAAEKPLYTQTQEMARGCKWKICGDLLWIAIALAE